MVLFLLGVVLANEDNSRKAKYALKPTICDQTIPANCSQTSDSGMRC